jgi:DegV family protein with EDD domain
MDGNEYPDDLGQTMPFTDFYSRIAAGSMATTSQVNTGEFIEFFEPFLQNGQDVLHLSLSSAISGTCNSANLAAKELEERYPGRKVFVVDSLAASAGFGMLTDSAADLRDADVSIEEAYQWVEENKLLLHHWFFATDLTHLKRGGRISASSAFMGTLLNICPLLNINSEGKLIPRAKIRGKKQVLLEIMSRMEQHAQDGLNHPGKCFISHANCLDDAKRLAIMIEEKFPHLATPVSISDIGAVVGAHTGPGTVALFFYGDKRTV